MKKTMILALLAIFGLSMFSTTYAAQIEEAGMKWYDDMDEAKAAAEKEKKLIYIYFTGGKGCGWCVKMKGETFSDKDVQKKVLSKYVLAMLNVWVNPKDSDKALMKKFGGSGVPFNVVVDKDVNLVKKFPGFKTADAFIKELEDLPDAYTKLSKLLKKVEKKSGQKYKNFYEIAQIYSNQLGDKVKGGEFAQKALDKDEKNKEGNKAELTYYLFEKAFAENKVEDGMKLLEEVKKIDSKNETGYYEKTVQVNIALALNKKEYDKAIKIYDDFVESDIDFHKDQKQMTKWYVAIVYIRKNDSANAKRMLKEVIEIDKNSEIGKSAAQTLEKLGGGSSGF